MPNLVGQDLTFNYSSVSYSSASGQLSSTGTIAVLSFEPVLGGTTYPVLNLAGTAGAAIALDALFDQVGTGFDVDGFFTTFGTDNADLTIVGQIPSLGITPGGPYTGTLLEAEVTSLELYGDAGSGAFQFHGYFRVTAGDLITAGYLNENDPVGMRSRISSTSPSLPEDFDFASDFTATTHEGEIGSVPEPASAALTLLAGGVLALVRRRRARGRT